MNKSTGEEIVAAANTAATELSSEAPWSFNNTNDMFVVNQYQQELSLEAQSYLPLWGILQAITCVNFFLGVYLLLALIHFGIRSKKLRAPLNQPKTRLLLLGIAGIVAHLVTIPFTEFNLLISIPLLDLGHQTPEGNYSCEMLMQIRQVLYGFAVLPTFAFLWYREHAF